MSVSLAVHVLEYTSHADPNRPCSMCQGQGPLYYFFIASGNEFGDSEPVCATCMSCNDVVLNVRLEEPEVEVPRTSSKRMRKRAQRQDRHVAELTGARIQPNSGATPFAKGDLRKKGELRIETKYTTKEGFRLTRKVLDKIRGECAMGEKPAVVITFTNPTTLATEDEWVVIPVEDWDAAGNNPGPDGS